MEENPKIENGQVPTVASQPQAPEKIQKMRVPMLVTAVVLLIILGLVSAFLPKKQEKVYHIGVLSGVSFFDPSFEGFKQKMSELGYVENKNIFYDKVGTDAPGIEEYTKLAHKLIADNNDLLLTYPTEATLVTKKVAAGKIPIVFSIGDTKGNDLVESVRHPGGNITGVQYPDVVDLSILRLEVLHQLMPKAKKVVLFSSPDYPIVPRQVEALKKAAPTMGIEFIDAPIINLGNVQAEVEAWAAKIDFSKVDAILQIDGPTGVVPPAFAAISDLAAKYNIPVSGMPVPPQIADKYQVIDYVLIDIPEAGKQAAILADKILRGGIEAGSIPLPSAEIYTDINYPATQKYGLTIPADLLGRANHITR